MADPELTPLIGLALVVSVLLGASIVCGIQVHRLRKRRDDERELRRWEVAAGATAGSMLALVVAAQILRMLG